MAKKDVNDYMIVDCHSHLWPTRELGIRSIQYVELHEWSGDHDGTVEDALAEAEATLWKDCSIVHMPMPPTYIPSVGVDS